MKNIWIFSAFFYCSVILGQTQSSHPFINCQVLGGSSPTANNNSSNCTILFQDYLRTPDITLHVNFHLTSIPTTQNQTALATTVRRILNDINTILGNFDFYRVGTTVPQIPHVPRAKIKLKLYTETTNTNDIFGGIWFYSDAAWTDRYSGRALNIRLRSPSDNVQGLGGSSDVGTWGSDFEVYHFLTQMNKPIDFFPSTIVHELGHRLGLNHPGWCFNECGTRDIDTIAECNSNCPSQRLCGPVASDNVGGTFCPGSVNTCNVCENGLGLSNLLTSGCFRYPRAMTPCQWERIFNDVRANNPLYALLCFTAATFNLATSPLNDYRASQSITSTSVITGDRMVDYWAPNIVLNAGFNVQAGTQFMAGPANFPCCDNPSTPPQLAGNSSDNRPTDIKVYPNPTTGKVFIELPLVEHNDNGFQVLLYDMQGRIHHKTRTFGSLNLDLPQTGSTVFILAVQHNETIRTFKVIKE